LVIGHWSLVIGHLNMPILCPRCRRANPDAAVFCYFDGVPLRPGAVPELPSVEPGAEVVFPSGRRCKDLHELREACQAEWNEGRQLLLKGEFVRFLQKLGRADLVRAAQARSSEGTAQTSTSQTDPDIALYNFLDQLPSSADSGPHLELQPRRLLLKNVTVGKHPQITLTVTNGGRGILQGKLIVSDGHEWIRIEGANGRQLGLRATRNQEVVLHLDTRVLLGGQTYTGKLTAITNGGIAEVPIRLDLAAAPFPQAPYQGASSPRDLAQRMQKNPKPAVALLESGDVSRWFAANGWSYPVDGEPAKGIGAVQQFFECLGLSKPPPLALSDSELRLQCQGDQVTVSQITLRTPSRKWVYAQVDSETPWLRITTPTVSGPQQAQISFEVDPATLAADQVHQGTIRIRANGNQKLMVRIQVDVRRPRPALSTGLVRSILVTALLGLVCRWLLALPADLYARLWMVPDPGAGTLAAWSNLPGAQSGFLRFFVLATWWLGGLIGLVLVWRQGGKGTDRLCGLAAGSAAGLAIFSVLACLLILLDALPRAIIQGLAGVVGADVSPWISTPLWLLTAGACWALLGTALGLVLGCLGERGQGWVSLLATPLVAICRLLRLEGAARWLNG
jgi:hypothetical protein